MFQGIILEGISGTGKTSVFESLAKHEKIQLIPAKSKLILSEHHTQRILELEEQQGILTPQHHIELLDQLVAFMEQLNHRTTHRGWHSDHLQEQDLFFLFERFHLTHVFRFPSMNWSQVVAIDHRLKSLGTFLCLLTVNAETLEKRLFSRRNKCWLNYLKQYGASPSEIVDTLLNRQKVAQELTALSSLPTLVIDTSENTIDQVTNLITTECLPDD